ncbi:MAG: N-acetyl-gamma-glutamyl-phosphate reductase [Burkholderiaceae bacterium]
MIRAGIVGGTGYTGVELLRLLAQHPGVTITAITSRKEAGTRVSEMYSSLRGRVDLAFSDMTDDGSQLKECDVVFFATPHGVAMSQARGLLDAGVKVIDLAADFRLQDPAEFQQWYKMEHTATDLLRQAVYGLAEVNRESLRTARLVGLAGCYPTAVQLGLKPLLSSPTALIDETSIIADCKSGVSGAGRKAEVQSLFTEASDNFKAYGLAGHRHLPEIRQGLSRMAGRPVELTFIPHLLPMIRGILATIYVRLSPTGLATDIQRLYEDHYAGEAFVDVMPPGSSPETRSVRASNLIRLAVHQPQGGNTLVVLAAIDNLVKGAAGQAVQVMNLMFGQEETTGLRQIPILP